MAVTGFILVLGVLLGSGYDGWTVNVAEAQDLAVSRCVEVVPHYYSIDGSDARLLCPGIVEAMRDARDDEALDRNNSCDLFLSLGMDDSDETAKQACLAVFVVVM